MVLAIIPFECQRRRKELALDAQIPAKVRLRHIDMFNFDVHIVHLVVGLLCAFESASSA